MGTMGKNVVFQGQERGNEEPDDPSPAGGLTSGLVLSVTSCNRWGMHFSTEALHLITDASSDLGCIQGLFPSEEHCVKYLLSVAIAFGDL